MAPRLTDDQAYALGEKTEAKARDFFADPSKGHAAGYIPEPKFQRVQELGGRQAQTVPVRGDYAAWLYGVARQDLTACRWRIDEFLGDGPTSASIVILT